MSSPLELRDALAHWLAPDLLALPAWALPEGRALEDLDWWLLDAPDGGAADLLDDLSAATLLPLTPSEGALPVEAAQRFPHLADHHVLHPSPEVVARADQLLRGQVVLVGTGAETGDGAPRAVMATSLQIPGVLDALDAGRARSRELGVTWSDGIPSLTVWAPTARRVELLLWPGRPDPGTTAAWAPTGDPETVPMERADDGCWTVQGRADWADRCYRLALEHVWPGTGRIRTVTTTDPWSHGLALDSTHSVFVDLDDPRYRPERWTATPNPDPIRPVDQAIWELHVRDFSRDDDRVAPELRGTYLAFGEEGHGRAHLRELAGAGLTTVHLLPTFDLTSVPEDPAHRVRLDHEALAALPPDSDEQQRQVLRAGGEDAFNWGYDPWHFLVAEGSYCSTPGAAHGGRRAAEFRTMVGALHELGLRVVLDQVYNHTTDAGLDPASVLDRVVPGYYHRLDGRGRVETSTCCQNLATEHAMAEKLMVDGCVLWVRAYRVDGFRFDLMGHHSRSTMEQVRAALDALTLERDGIEGRHVLLYGEGWNFGEVAGNARFHQAVQGQLAGTGIGCFNDRIRDAVRGGGVGDEDMHADLGFATGGRDGGDVDALQVGLAGGLAAIRFRSQATGEEVRGDELRYGAAPSGFATEPEESVNYVDAHDNETLWDTLLLKLPRDTPMAERVRRNTLALAAVTLSQGISFWHAGAEILRSKSLDRNSYASGDWFNVLVLGLGDNGFGRGLPSAPDNRRRWDAMRPLLADRSLVPTVEDQRTALRGALDLLRLRSAHPGLRLGSAQEILRRVTFPVSGTGHGGDDLVVMHVEGEESLLVVLNGAVSDRAVTVPGLVGQDWSLSPVLTAAGADPVTALTRWDAGEGQVHVPGLTAAVLVRAR